MKICVDIDTFRGRFCWMLVKHTELFDEKFKHDPSRGIGSHDHAGGCGWMQRMRWWCIPLLKRAHDEGAWMMLAATVVQCVLTVTACGCGLKQNAFICSHCSRPLAPASAAMLGWKAIFTLVVVVLLFVVLAFNKWNDTLLIFLAYAL